MRTVTNRRRRAVRSGLPRTLALSAWVAAVSCTPPIHGDVPRLETPDWTSSGTLALRRTKADEADSGFLLRHPEHPTVYRYDTAALRLSTAPAGQWPAATTPIVVCDPARLSTLRIDAPSRRLLGPAGNPVETAGSSVLGSWPARGGHSVAILSAARAGHRAMLPFLGSGGGDHQHFHQLHDPRTGQPTGTVFRLPLVSEGTVLLACWSPDDGYVIYHDRLFRNLAIVPNDRSKG